MPTLPPAEAHNAVSVPLTSPLELGPFFLVMALNIVLAFNHKVMSRRATKGVVSCDDQQSAGRNQSEAHLKASIVFLNAPPPRQLSTEDGTPLQQLKS